MKNIILVLFIVSFFAHCANKEKNNENNIQTKVQKVISKNNVEDAVIFQRVQEPKENAFSLLIPKGWKLEGGIFRVDPLTQGGPSQSIAAKLDFSVKKDNEGSVMIRWLPDVLFFDARYSPAGQMGLFPEGSNYQGMTVMNIPSAKDFIRKVIFNYTHPSILNYNVIESQVLNNVAQNYTVRVKQLVPYSTMSYDAALVKITYSENNKKYEEWIFSIIENWGQLGAGMWGNKETFLIRAQKGEIKKWEPIFSVIQNSVKINLQWLIGEIKGQAIRGEIAANTQKEIERIGREITEHRQKTNAEINNDMYLTLTEQEEYVNPYTNEVEVGTNQWKYRWVNESGDVIYTDNEDYNPNIDINLNRSDYKRSQIRKRFP
ncbi:MAG: hypothetical protein KDC88_04140 [Ignavibacteriae bacterium]|nr:hypothetical protein [Ignavibacteriota bacterium]MCB9208079.1 hypothetical protein [Ignavibacteriales bacterium]